MIIMGFPIVQFSGVSTGAFTRIACWVDMRIICIMGLKRLPIICETFGALCKISQFFEIVRSKTTRSKKTYDKIYKYSQNFVKHLLHLKDFMILCDNKWLSSLCNIPIKKMKYKIKKMATHLTFFLSSYCEFL